MALDIVAVASLLWLPLTSVRVVRNRGAARHWALLSCCAFGVVLLGFTRAMAGGGTAIALLWSLAWAAPVGLALAARTDPFAAFRRDDRWVGLVAAVTFALPFLPALLQLIRDAIW